MSLWQGTKWSHRQTPSASAINPPRLSFSGNSSAATSQSSFAAGGSGAGTPRRPLNALGIRQEGRSNSQPPSRSVEITKPSHDPVKTLLAILGEDPAVKEEEDSSTLADQSQKADAGGKTLAEWLEELEKEESNKLSTVIDKRLCS
jgi:hypothetical protein